VLPPTLSSEHNIRQQQKQLQQSYTTTMTQRSSRTSTRRRPAASPSQSAAAASAAKTARTLLVLACCATLIPGSAAIARYNPWNFNKACRYSATNIPANLFRNGVDKGAEYLFPLEDNRAVDKYERPWEACFGPKETYNLAAIEAGWKLPCKYQVNAKGNYDYEEEHACEVLIKANCYCYAVDRFVGSYCEPGLGGTGQPFKLPSECLFCSGFVFGLPVQRGCGRSASTRGCGKPPQRVSPGASPPPPPSSHPYHAPPHSKRRSRELQDRRRRRRRGRRQAGEPRRRLQRHQARRGPLHRARGQARLNQRRDGGLPLLAAGRQRRVVVQGAGARGRRFRGRAKLSAVVIGCEACEAAAIKTAAVGV